MKNGCHEIKIRKMLNEDFDLVRPWLNDPENSKWLKSVYRFGKYNQITHQLSLSQRSSLLYLGLYRDIPVGLVGLSNIDRIDKTAMVWYVVANKELHGKGIGTRLVNLILKEAFVSLDLTSVYASVVENNWGSYRVLEKNNFRRIGVQRQCHLSNDGSFKDRIVFDLLSSERPI
jgi:diamine N-acetyltransferase